MAEPTIVQLLGERDYAAIARRAVREVIARIYNNGIRDLRSSYNMWAFSGGTTPQPGLAEAFQLWFHTQEDTGIVFTRREREEIDHEIETHIRELCEKD
ncbi:MAG: hypothetical protein A2991_00070 [Candidatus Terrybacteria bacterium RIFCSPLOWO2_01_FULL_58_14]|uniref:Uncharacterized protein n=2 Tax=Candidatus Terryibacteriota TaxID=1817920 RepID=A0A1G2PYI4_9BACT|nr:MAG: hypothetical protein A2682_01045 [Candidatus Terrybacteria bacterium RIFCSPHIGHO2_01_FULL_58_15]OHA53388.1 MAG: hypothetical protein A2991_00070 [Candidatus Terrybacteria bacterium RIFCSPLOWO2_01_FULL_58_14]